MLEVGIVTRLPSQIINLVFYNIGPIYLIEFKILFMDFRLPSTEF